jgi:uncharacterized protein YdeI (YjbR/CyaY-like superfamily)
MAELGGVGFSNREEWRRWLHENGSTQDGIWVVIQKKGSRKKGLRLEEAVDEAVCFGWIDGGMRSVDDDSFILRFSPRRRNSIWSLKNVERAEMMIEVGRMTEAGLEAIEEAKRDGRWESAYTSRVEPEVPEELERALRESPKAWENFKDFPNSTKLQYVHWVVTAKREKTRLRRILEVVRRAAKNIRPS